VNAAIVKQVVKVAKIDAKNEAQVEKQNDSDKLKIQELQGQLIAARAAAASHGVPKPPHTAVCQKPKAMPELVKQPVPTSSQLDAMKKRIGAISRRAPHKRSRSRAAAPAGSLLSSAVA
jgi:hypothetical protein